MSHSIRAMAFEDVDKVFRIEKRTHIAPWTKGIIHDCIEVGYGCFVLESASKIKGFAIARAAADECHLLNLCIAPEAQGQGYGESLLLYVIEKVKEHCSKVILEVRPSNFVARKLYQKHHFEETGYRKNYYHDPDGSSEDGIVLTLNLDDE